MSLAVAMEHRRAASHDGACSSIRKLTLQKEKKKHDDWRAKVNLDSLKKFAAELPKEMTTAPCMFDPRKNAFSAKSIGNIHHPLNLRRPELVWGKLVTSYLNQCHVGVPLERATPAIECVAIRKVDKGRSHRLDTFDRQRVCRMWDAAQKAIDKVVESALVRK